MSIELEKLQQELWQKVRNDAAKEGWSQKDYYELAQKIYNAGRNDVVDSMQRLINTAGGIGGLRHFQDMLETARTAQEASSNHN